MFFITNSHGTLHHCILLHAELNPYQLRGNQSKGIHAAGKYLKVLLLHSPVMMPSSYCSDTIYNVEYADGNDDHLTYEEIINMLNREKEEGTHLWT